MLRLDNIKKSFGGVKALDGVSFQVEKGEMLGLIGPNGAGKTTLFNIICGLLSPEQGKIYFENQEITGRAPHRIAQMGIQRTFQNLAIFKEMTVLENLMVGSHLMGKAGFFSAIFKLPWERKEEKEILKRAWQALEEINLKKYAHLPAHHLPFGKMRLLELARSLCAHPRILLLDEPAAGLNQKETEELCQFLSLLRQKEITMVIIDHDMDLIMETSDRVIVLDQGRKIAEGTPGEIQRNPLVLKAYLGDESWYQSLKK